MTALIRSLATAVPPTLLPQDRIRDVLAAQPGVDRLSARLIPAVFNASGIERRYTCVQEWEKGLHDVGQAASPEEVTLGETSGAQEEPGVFFDPGTHHVLSPSTGVRNAIYATEATKLYVEAAQGALERAPEIAADQVTHVITVSCTGFYSPGPDYQIVRQLGLSSAVKRLHIGFMGCYAAMPALREAASICQADPAAVVLVVSVELCTLHVRVANDQDTILGASLFADGGAAALVTGADAPALPEGRPALELDRFSTVLTPVGEDAMAWNIGDEGFEMILGSYVPHIIDEHITDALKPLLGADTVLSGRPHREVEHWAIHPGGRSILDKVQARLDLADEQLVASRETLRDYGNMSSATVMFVLQHIMESAGEPGERICAMAFGPGLTVESALLTRAAG
ncbi:type III polyketide synthase [Micrococcus terreus]|uniref:type III polyketide synthase n=1 Tax=Micrococcus terreus TaxID=574650 RepID=UPI003D761B1C